MNGSANEADVLKFLDCGSFGSGSGAGSVYGSGSGDGAGYGYGDGAGYGEGSSCGSGSGAGSGYGYGSEDGSGDGAGYGRGRGASCGSSCSQGDGDGHGYGDGIKTFNKQKVVRVDSVETIISSVHGGYARGYILLDDLTLKPTYIAKVGGTFAHGDTLRKAREDAAAKYMDGRPIEQRISEFIKAHPSKTRKYSGEDLYRWHGILTGSCHAGRDAWCRDKGLDPKTTKLTVKQFCELTKDAYGGDVITRLAETMEINI